MTLLNLPDFHHKLRLWWLTITAPDTPINLTIEKNPYEDIEFLADCPKCNTTHTFEKLLQTDTTHLGSWAATIHHDNQKQCITLFCSICNKSTTLKRGPSKSNS